MIHSGGSRNSPHAIRNSAPARGQSARGLIQHARDRPGHDRRYAVDGSKIARLGFTAATPLRAGLAATVQWYPENHSRRRAIVTGEYGSSSAQQYSQARA